MVRVSEEFRHGGADMRAVVVYESMFGNTHRIAEQIGEGLRSRFEVTVVPLAEATPDVLAGADFVVVGGPTHVHGLSRESSREAAVAMEGDEGLELDADAPGPGLREWLAALGDGHVHAAVAFDTRADAPVLLTGRAGPSIGRRLAKHGYRVVDDPESFIVDKHNHLLPGESDRAARWGADLARVFAATPSS
jgi:hypothetical protein